MLLGTGPDLILNGLGNWINGEMYLPQTVHAAPMPVQAYLINPIYADIASTFALLFIIILILPLSGVLTELAVEKETKMREVLRIYGVGQAGMIGSWYTWCTFKFFVTAVLMAMASTLQLFPNSSFEFLFFLLLLLLLPHVDHVLRLHGLPVLRPEQDRRGRRHAHLPPPLQPPPEPIHFN